MADPKTCDHPASTATADDLARWAAWRPQVRLGDDDLARVRTLVGESDDDTTVREAAAALAVARFLRLPWNPPGASRRGRKPAAVGDTIDVRTAREGDPLAVHPNDDRTRTLVLVWGRAPVLHLVGWGVTDALRRKEHWTEDRRRSAYWRVPAHRLNRFPMLPSLVR